VVASSIGDGARPRDFGKIGVPVKVGASMVVAPIRRMDQVAVIVPIHELVGSRREVGSYSRTSHVMLATGAKLLLTSIL
jgi:hypothetical protein